jgi:sec-independent protein translocase protein TatA
MYTGTLLEFLNMGGGEIMLILAVVLLLFGGKKLPELARGLGKGIRDFKDASEGVKREIHRNINSMDIDDELKRDSQFTPSPVVTEPLVNTDPVEHTAAVSDTAADEHTAPVLNTDPVQHTVPLQPKAPVSHPEEEIKPTHNI